MMAQPEIKRPDSLKLRLISAIIMIPAGLFVVWSGGPVLLAAALLCAVGMWFEYWDVTTSKKPDPVMIGLGALLAGAIVTSVLLEKFALIVCGGVVLVSLALVFLLKVSRPIWLTVGLVLIGFAVFSLNDLRDGDDDRLFLTLITMAGVWITDIAAYFAGRGFGGPQLSPRGSPNKTWSGAVGAMICTALVGAFVAGLMNSPMISWIVFMAGVSAIGQLGDLCQSYWKRHFGVKDSGALIPGHGGLLDRLDSFSAVLIVLGLLLQFHPGFPEEYLGLRAL